MDTENMMAFYEPGKTHLYSLAVYQDGEWRTQYDRETLDEVRAARGEHMQLVPFNEACRMIDDAQMAAYCHAPVEITREQFWEMLEVLPPCKWERSEACEAFYVSEALGQTFTLGTSALARDIGRSTDHARAMQTRSFRKWPQQRGCNYE